MLVEFTKHCDTSEGRKKIGSQCDLPDSEAMTFISENKCKPLGVIEYFDEQDACLDTEIDDDCGIYE